MYASAPGIVTETDFHFGSKTYLNTAHHVPFRAVSEDNPNFLSDGRRKHGKSREVPLLGLVRLIENREMPANAPSLMHSRLEGRLAEESVRSNARKA